MNNFKHLEYLGDGVYAGHDGYQVWLTTGSHMNPPLLALDPNVLQSLVRYAEHTLKIEVKS